MTTPTTAADTVRRVACPSDEDATVHGYISDKTKYHHRLRRLEGQVRGIDRMVDEERYCIDILTQISAITRALEGVALSLLDDHLKHCLLDAAVAGDPVSEQQLAEASQAISRLVRS